MENISGNFESSRYALARKSVLLLFIIICIATITRPLVADLPIILTIIGTLNAVLTGSVYLLMTFTKPRAIYVYLVVASGIVCLVPLLLASGGIHSQFAPLLLLIPISVVLFGGVRVGIISTLFILLLVALLRVYNNEISSLDPFEYSANVLNARTFWLCLGSIFGLYFSLQFEKMSSKLGAKLHQQANYDPLTNILNRRSVLGFLDALVDTTASQSEAGKTWVSVLMIDLDFFKSINDTHGHLAGDKCLIAVATCLQQSIRKDYDAAGRYGGEEFIAILNGTNQKQAAEVAEKIRVAISQIEICVNEQHIGLSATIGYCSSLVSDAISTDNLIQRADEALYRGKKQSRNCVVGN